jgi:hypothetical protein
MPRKKAVALAAVETAPTASLGERAVFVVPREFPAGSTLVVGEARKRRRGRHYPVTLVLPDGRKLDRESPSVTTIINKTFPKPALTTWAARVERALVLDAVETTARHVRQHKQGPPTGVEGARWFRERVAKALPYQYACTTQRDSAGDTGKSAHEWVSWHVRKALGVEAPEPALKGAAETAAVWFLEWEKEVQATWIASEEGVASWAHDYAGTIDLRAAIVRGKEPVHAALDLKTGNGIYDEARVQLAGYALAWNESHPEDAPIRYGIVARLPKDDDPSGKVECEDLDEDDLAYWGRVFLAARGLWGAFGRDG